MKAPTAHTPDPAEPAPDTAQDAGGRAAELREAMVDALAATIDGPAVEAALRRVPRHLFVPDVPLNEAYADDCVYTKHDPVTGARISAASQPRIIAMMLDQLDVQPGDRVLEIGAGTGYHAALLAEIAGPAGHVCTLDVDDDLVTAARDHLATAAAHGVPLASAVEVVTTDGALGHPWRAPYERIVATVGAHDVPRPWLDQLAPGGRLVVPVRLAGMCSRSIAFEHDPGDGGWRSVSSEMTTFMPLRGLGDDARQVHHLTGTAVPPGTARLQVHRDNLHANDPATLHGVLDTPRHVVRTGVLFRSGESVEWLYLWLCCRLPNPLMRLDVDRTLITSGVVARWLGTHTVASTDLDGTLAYLTLHPLDPDRDVSADGEPRHEVGVVGHGPHAAHLTELIAAEIRTWDRAARHHAVAFHLPGPPPAQPLGAHSSVGTDTKSDHHVVLRRSDLSIDVTWTSGR